MGAESTFVIRTVLAAALVLVASLPSAPASRQPQGTSAAFRVLFEQYRSGDFDDAVDAFSRWDAARVERDTTLQPEARDLKSMAALALLLTEVGIRNRTFGLPVGAVTLPLEGGWRRLEEWRKLAWPPGDIEKQKDLLLGPPSINRRVMNLDDFDVYSRTALRLVREIVRRTREQEDTALLEFCRSWYILTVSFVPPSTPAHMPLRRSALVDFGDDPEILLLVGSTAFGRQAQEATLGRALALDPVLVEARVRHGRVLQELGRNDEAYSELERAARDAHEAQSVVVEYLAQLFLGRLHEDARRLDEAVKCYKAAAALNPNWQVAHVALGSLRVTAGSTEEGWAAGRVALGDAATPRRPDIDPWYLYRRALYWQAGRRIQAMRAAVRP